MFDPFDRNHSQGQGDQAKPVKLQEVENQIVIVYEVYDEEPTTQICSFPLSRSIEPAWPHAAPGGGRCHFLLRERSGVGVKVSVRCRFAHRNRGSRQHVLNLSVETRLNGFKIGPFEFVVSSSSLGRCRNRPLLLPEVFGA